MENVNAPADDDRRYPSRPLLAASAAIFRGDLVLVAQRAPSATLPGLWSLPGGLVEPGERLADAAARELLEETGVTAQMIAPVDIVEVIRADGKGAAERHYVIVAFAGIWLSGEAQAQDGTAAVRWLRLDEIDTLDLTDGTADAIRKAADLAGASG